MTSTTLHFVVLVDVFIIHYDRHRLLYYLCQGNKHKFYIPLTFSEVANELISLFVEN